MKENNNKQEAYGNVSELSDLLCYQLNLNGINKIQESLMKKVEHRPYDKDYKKDGCFNYIHQEYIADAFNEIRKLLGA